MSNEDTNFQIETIMDKPCKECGASHSIGAYLNDDTNTYWIECFQCDYEYDSNLK